DILLYPELGMDPLTMKLASMRLVPLQMVSWGHPETSGLPTIDYYLSAELFEPSQSQNHYREKLIRLPNLGCCIDPHDVGLSPLNDSDLGIVEGDAVFVCPGMPFKYMPEYDSVLVRIAQRVNHAKFVFFQMKQVQPLSDLLLARLSQSFEQAGLDPTRYLRMTPWRDTAGFHAVLKRANVFLDTIGFSGFNTVMHAMECATPIVTFESDFMRGRFGSAILRRAGLDEFVCLTQDEYVDLAVRLIDEPPKRTNLIQAIEGGRSRLYGDKEPMQALGNFLARVPIPETI
ncbi:MAG: hypothetical protein KGN37_12685, partial [Burkholderiales bacterium]|nr:hypothetical protein [Burkholderiales bacterium]